jgi:outer membrane lipoprotein-sorting protein
MISGGRRILVRAHKRLASVLMGMALLFGCVAAHAQAWGLPDLMRMLARHKSANATFTEKKFIAVMDQPLESAGELSYTAPDKLEKRTLTPKVEIMTLDGDQLSVQRAGRRRMSVSLQSRPEAAAFVESVRGTMSGDLNALQKYYTLELSGRADAWKLALVPTQPGMLKIMSRIRIEGTQDALTLIVFDQADGDRSEMHIVAANSP